MEKSGGKAVLSANNAANASDRDVLGQLEQYERCHCGIPLIKADVYKSNGIAQRLNVAETPCVVFIRDRQQVGCVNCGDICPASIDELVRR